MNKWIKAAALAAALPLAACGSGPSDADISKALADFAVSMGASEKQAAPKSLTESKCSKAPDADAWDCAFLLEGDPRRARFVKFDAGWKLVGGLN